MRTGPAASALSRRRLLGLGGAAGAAALLSACTATQAGSTGIAAADFVPSLDPPTGLEKRQLTVGYVPITCGTPIVTAAGLGVYEKYGLEVTLRRYTGWAELWIAFVAGELDATQMLAPMPLAIHHNFASGQRNLRLPFVTNTNGNGVTVARSLRGTVKGPEDFAGLRVGLPFDYSVHSLLMRDYLASGGLNPERDVDLRIMRPADMVTALAVGELDAFCLPDQFNQRAVAEGVGFIHLLTKDLWPDHPCCSFAVGEDFASANPNSYAALLSALADVSLWIDEPAHRAQTADLMAAGSALGMPKPVLQAVLTGKFADGTGRKRSVPDRIGFQPYPHESYGVWMLDAMNRGGLTGTQKFAQAADYSTAVRSVFDSRSAATVLDRLGGDTREHLSETVLGRTFDPRHPKKWSI
ncbi:CmpA/NrtA family ABC transporter substrate-binding protein [Brevibacterium spongiae]|uniref:ABC transporter substrate-binding protein n=1 Tax=Brevibacterium spongiae TaxID=2909672 RepID=A0ABY5SU95_9MICO|nr:CmpA/NrtA family ABC transporter substrate-binding protein [Brevibacterium spongiae]UVI36723.1 ABC transporter substrate-binding protein [Brevibacterium spongiae]